MGRKEEIQALSTERFEEVDPEPMEAMLALPRVQTMREQLAQYIEAMRSDQPWDESTAEVQAQLRDFVEENEEDRVLSDYQLEAMAAMLTDEEALELATRVAPAGSESKDEGDAAEEA